MRICFLSLDYPSATGGGGVGSQVREIARAMVKAGHDASVIALTSGEPREFSDQGVLVHQVRPSNIHWYFFKLPLLNMITLALRELEYGWAVYRKFITLDRKKRFDVAEGTETGSFWVSLLANKRLVIRLHGEHYTFHTYTPDEPLTPSIRICRILQRITIKKARVLISPSESHANEIRGELMKADLALRIIPNSVNLSEYSTRKKPNSEGKLVLFVGRIERRKGVMVLLEAAAQVLADMPEVQFVLAGAIHPTIPILEFERAMDELNVRDCVELAGHKTEEKLKELYHRATILVLPSYYETFGIVALEAMAYGIPVVAWNAGALPEIVKQGVNGILVKPGSPDELAAGLIQLMRDPEKLEKMSAEARRTAAAYDTDELLAINIKAYSSVGQS